VLVKRKLSHVKMLQSTMKRSLNDVHEPRKIFKTLISHDPFVEITVQSDDAPMLTADDLFNLLKNKMRKSNWSGDFVYGGIKGLILHNFYSNIEKKFTSVERTSTEGKPEYTLTRVTQYEYIAYSEESVLCVWNIANNKCSCTKQESMIPDSWLTVINSNRVAIVYDEHGIYFMDTHGNHLGTISKEGVRLTILKCKTSYKVVAVHNTHVELYDADTMKKEDQIDFTNVNWWIIELNEHTLCFSRNSRSSTIFNIKTRNAIEAPQHLKTLSRMTRIDDTRYATVSASELYVVSESGQLLQEIKLQGVWVNLLVGVDKNKLLTNDNDGNLILWDISTGKKIHQIQIEKDSFGLALYD
jgi:WD40 repeat protein